MIRDLLGFKSQFCWQLAEWLSRKNSNNLDHNSLLFQSGWYFSALKCANIPEEGYGQWGPSVSYWQDLVSIALTQNGLQPQAHSMYRMFRAGQPRWNHTTPNTRSWLPLTRVSCELWKVSGAVYPVTHVLKQGSPQSDLWTPLFAPGDQMPLPDHVI